MHSDPMAGGLISYIDRMWHLWRPYQGSCSPKGRNVHVIWYSKDVSCRLTRFCSIALARDLSTLYRILYESR